MLLRRLIMSIFISVLLCSNFLCYVSASENSGEEIYDEQQSIADELADDAYDSVTDKIDENLDSDNIYDSVMNTVNKNKDKNFGKSFLRGFYSAYSTIRAFSPAIGIISVFVGVIIARFSTKNKKLRRWGITIAVMVPVLLVVIVFGIGYFNDIFLH